MATIAITTTQNIELEYELASLGERILGRLLDEVILAAYVIGLLFLIGFANIGDFLDNNVWLAIILALPVVCYDLFSEVFFNGQSIGKRVTGIKVVSLNGERPSLSQYLIRWLFRIVDFTFSGGMLAVIMVAATRDHQRLGDKVANTILIRTTPKSNFRQTLYMPTVDTRYQTTYPEVVQLSDADMQLVKEVIMASERSTHPLLALEAMRKIEKVLGIKSQTDPLPFLYTVLADYNHLTAQM